MSLFTEWSNDIRGECCDEFYYKRTGLTSEEFIGFAIEMSRFSLQRPAMKSERELAVRMFCAGIWMAQKNKDAIKQ